MMAVAIVAASAGGLGCDSAPGDSNVSGSSAGQTSSSLSPMMEAYYRAHPGLVDGPLRPAPRAASEIVAEIQAELDAGEDIWLPDYLPAGFVLAAPYNGTGTGSAYPNPYAFGRRYSVTYTNGRGYIMVMKNSEDDLSGGQWTPLTERVDGRALRLHSGSDVTLIATVEDGDDSLLVAGADFADDRLADELVMVAASLTRR